MFRSVVVGAADSEGAERAFRRALALTQATGGTLHIVAAIDGKKEPKRAPWLPEEFRYTAFGASATDWLLMRLAKEASDAQVDVATHPVLADPAECHRTGCGRRGGRSRRRRVRLPPTVRAASLDVPKAVMDTWAAPSWSCRERTRTDRLTSALAPSTPMLGAVAGSCATAARESSQGRKAAALSGYGRVP